LWVVPESRGPRFFLRQHRENRGPRRLGTKTLATIPIADVASRPRDFLLAAKTLRPGVSSDDGERRRSPFLIRRGFLRGRALHSASLGVSRSSCECGPDPCSAVPGGRLPGTKNSRRTTPLALHFECLLKLCLRPGWLRTGSRSSEYGIPPLGGAKIDEVMVASP